jgi:LacI family transcriptional regulator
MTDKPSVTVRSLAAELGVSPITVSRALRGHDTVRPELAVRVKWLAKKRGYRADPIMAEVMGGLGRVKGTRYRETVAFVWTHERSESDREEHGARAAAEALGYRFEIVKPWTQGLNEHDVSRILWSRGIRGVLLAPNYSRPDPRYELEWPKFAAVLLGSSLVNTGVTRVARDYYHDAKLALARLEAAGFARIGLALDSSTHERTDRRYAAAFREHGGTAARFHLVDASRPEAAQRTRYGRWLTSAKPDAVLTDFSRSQEWSTAPLPHARLMLRPGEKGPGVRADFARVGAEAMRMLDGLLRENRLGLLSEPVSVLVPGAWQQ